MKHDLENPSKHHVITIFSSHFNQTPTPLFFIKEACFSFYTLPFPNPKKKHPKRLMGRNLGTLPTTLRCQFFTEDVIIFFQPTCQRHLFSAREGRAQVKDQDVWAWRRFVVFFVLLFLFCLGGDTQGKDMEKNEIRFYFVVVVGKIGG